MPHNKIDALNFNSASAWSERANDERPIKQAPPSYYNGDDGMLVLVAIMAITGFPAVILGLLWILITKGVRGLKEI